MDAKERYYWDVTGHLVVRDVLSQEELDGVKGTAGLVLHGAVRLENTREQQAAD